MTKAKAKSSRLDIRSETMKGYVPKTQIQMMATELGQMCRARSLFDEIRLEAGKALRNADDKKQESEDLSLKHIRKTCEDFDNIASVKAEAIVGYILEAEPRDAIDALIALLLFASEVESGEDWVEQAFVAQTEEERAAVTTAYLKEYDRYVRIMAGIARGLTRGLDVLPSDLGLQWFWTDGSNHDFHAQVNHLKIAGADLGIIRRRAA